MFCVGTRPVLPCPAPAGLGCSHIAQSIDAQSGAWQPAFQRFGGLRLLMVRPFLCQHLKLGAGSTCCSSEHLPHTLMANSAMLGMGPPLSLGCWPVAMKLRLAGPAALLLRALVLASEAAGVLTACCRWSQLRLPTCFMVLLLQAGDLAIVEYLLQNGASYDKLDSFSRSPLHYSIMFDHPAISKQLLRRWAAAAGMLHHLVI